MQLVDPATEVDRGHVATTSPADVDRALARAVAARRGWARTTPAERSAVLLRLADAVEDAAEELARLDSEDVGKPIAHAREELPGIVDVLRFTAGAARVPGPGGAAEHVEGRTSVLRREPVGVVGLITPWNYPLLQAVWKIAPALAAGCTAVVKPSELSPRSTLRLAELAAPLLPAGVLQVVLGDAAVGHRLATHPAVDLVSLTGSIGAGRAVAAAAAAAAGTLKRVHLELGGKAPVLVLDDADLDRAVDVLVPAAFLNAGQDCTAPCRLLVADAVHDRFLAAYLERVRDLRLGDPADPSTQLGPLVSRAQLERVAGYIDRARAAGAVVHTGGQRVERPGWFYPPTVVSGVRQDAEIVQQEVFGPVVTLQRVGTDDEMVELANDVEHGLAAGVWTSSLDRSQRLVQDLDFGTVWINDHLTTTPEMPFGGFGSSGHGTELSVHSIEDYSRTKHVMTRVHR